MKQEAHCVSSLYANTFMSTDYSHSTRDSWQSNSNFAIHRVFLVECCHHLFTKIVQKIAQIIQGNTDFTYKGEIPNSTAQQPRQTRQKGAYQ